MALLAAGCASMGAVSRGATRAPTRSPRESRSRARRSRTRRGPRRLVERVRRPAARRADGRSARGQPDAEHRAARARARRSRSPTPARPRCRRASTPARVEHARALPRHGLVAAAVRRQQAHDLPAAGARCRGRSISGARTARRTRRRSAPRARRSRRVRGAARAVDEHRAGLRAAAARLPAARRRRTRSTTREQIYALTRDRNAAGLDSRARAEAGRIGAARDARAASRSSTSASPRAQPDRGAARAGPGPRARDRAPRRRRSPARRCPRDVPAELLGRRPDVVAQRWRIEARGHDIASAKARVLSEREPAGVRRPAEPRRAPASSAPRAAWSAWAPAVTLPIFDAGRLRANLAGKDADYDIAVEQYNQTLADAMRDVVDQLASFRSVRRQRAQQRGAPRDGARGLRPRAAALSRRTRQLPAGAVRRAAAARAAEPRRRPQARELELSINLVRALGGGFTRRLAARLADRAQPSHGESQQQ